MKMMSFITAFVTFGQLGPSSLLLVSGNKSIVYHDQAMVQDRSGLEREKIFTAHFVNREYKRSMNASFAEPCALIATEQGCAKENNGQHH